MLVAMPTGVGSDGWIDGLIAEQPTSLEHIASGVEQPRPSNEGDATD
jgi:hypothetical protein